MSNLGAVTPSPTRRVGVLARRLGPAFLDLPVLPAIVMLFIALAITAPVFLTADNMLNVLRQAAPLGVMACAQTLLMVSGGFDISVGSVYALSGIVAALVWQDMGWLGGVAALAVGAGVGLLNGVLVAVCGINPFMATLGTLLIARGISISAVSAGVVTVDDPGFRWIGTAELGGVDVQVWILVGVILILGATLRLTCYGRHLYAVGGNPEAARLAGIRVRVVRTSAFALSGLSAGLAGLMHASEVGAAKSDVGVGLEFSVLAAVVLGGTSLFGGRGNVWRTVVAVCFVAFLQNGLNLLNLAPFYQQAITGVVLLTAVAIDGARRRSRYGARAEAFS